MRGTLSVVAVRFVVFRIIPADAGNTISESMNRTPRKDHPRGCGEHNEFVQLNVKGKGSSPRMRGIHGAVCSQSSKLRIIPADAGNTPPLLPV